MNNRLRYKNYFGSVNYSANDEILYGKVLGIKDLVSFEGNSVKSLTASFKDAVDDYLATDIISQRLSSQRVD